MNLSRIKALRDNCHHNFFLMEDTIRHPDLVKRILDTYEFKINPAERLGFMLNGICMTDIRLLLDREERAERIRLKAVKKARHERNLTEKHKAA